MQRFALILSKATAPGENRLVIHIYFLIAMSSRNVTVAGSVTRSTLLTVLSSLGVELVRSGVNVL